MIRLAYKARLFIVNSYISFARQNQHAGLPIYLPFGGFI